MDEDICLLKMIAVRLLSDLGCNGQALTEDLISEMCRFGAAELHAVAAVIGGIASQEVIKVLYSHLQFQLFRLFIIKLLMVRSALGSNVPFFLGEVFLDYSQTLLIQEDANVVLPAPYTFFLFLVRGGGGGVVARGLRTFVMWLKKIV